MQKQNVNEKSGFWKEKTNRQKGHIRKRKVENLTTRKCYLYSHSFKNLTKTFCCAPNTVGEKEGPRF
jgi:hypothetical protein